MNTFEEIVKEIIWQKENVSLENAINELKTAFSQFTIEVANNIEDNKSCNLFYDASRKIRKTMETKKS